MTMHEDCRFHSVLWFSRHEMTLEQRLNLEEVTGGQVEVLQYSGSPENVHVPFLADCDHAGLKFTEQVQPLKELIKTVDIVAIVAPISLQQQILSVAGDKPVIMAVNKRERNAKGEFEFIFDKWERLVKIEVVKEDFRL